MSQLLANESFLSHSCQAVETFSYRFHRLATVATQVGDGGYPVPSFGDGGYPACQVALSN